MNIKIIEPIGQSETAIRARLKDLLEKGGHHLFICDTRGLTDGELIQNVRDADILLLSNRPLSRPVIEACPNILINTARGPVVDQSALIEALDQHRLAGAGLDVFDIEPPLPANHPIFKSPNTVLLPHIGFETVEAMSAKADIALHHLENFLSRRSAVSS